MLTEIDVLKQQIEALEKLLKIKDSLIKELEAKAARNQWFDPTLDPVRIPNSIPSVWQVPPQCAHEYPNPWFGTMPPNCKKCGQSAPTYTVTSSTSDSV